MKKAALLLFMTMIYSSSIFAAKANYSGYVINGLEEKKELSCSLTIQSFGREGSDLVISGVIVHPLLGEQQALFETKIPRENFAPEFSFPNTSAPIIGFDLKVVQGGIVAYQLKLRGVPTSFCIFNSEYALAVIADEI